MVAANQVVSVMTVLFSMPTETASKKTTAKNVPPTCILKHVPQVAQKNATLRKRSVPCNASLNVFVTMDSS